MSGCRLRCIAMVTRERLDGCLLCYGYAEREIESFFAVSMVSWLSHAAYTVRVLLFPVS